MINDGIIFDLDGTLWDSTKEVTVSWQKVLREQPDIQHVPDEEAIYSVMGLSSDALMAKLFPDLSPERNQELFRLCGIEEQKHLLEHGGTLYPGTEETLRELSKRLPLFIVSNCGVGYIETFLEAHKLHRYFKDFECFGNTLRPKSENIASVAKRNGLQSPVYVGDTQWDYENATAAGVPFIFAAYGFGDVKDVPSIQTIRELTQITL